MKTNIIKVAGLGFIGILMASAVWAQPPRYGNRGWGFDGPRNRYFYGPRDTTLANRPYRMMGRMDWLDLSEEQQEELSTLRTEYSEALTPQREKMTELRAAERTLLSEEDVDLDAVNKNLDEQSDLTASIRKLQVEHQVKVKGILTDEQVTKLQSGRQYAQGNRSYGRNWQRGNRGYWGPQNRRGYWGPQTRRGFRGR